MPPFVEIKNVGPVPRTGLFKADEDIGPYFTSAKYWS